MYALYKSTIYLLTYLLTMRNNGVYIIKRLYSVHYLDYCYKRFDYR